MIFLNFHSFINLNNIMKFVEQDKKQAIQQLSTILATTRKSISVDTANIENRVDEATHMKNKVVDQMLKIQNYVIVIQESVALVEKGKIKQSIFAVKQNEQPQKININLYLWQLFNFITIHLEHFPAEFVEIVNSLLRLDTFFEIIHSPNSLKNALIFIHNWLSKYLKAQTNQNQWINLRQAICFVLIHHFERRQNQSIKLKELFKNSKTEEHLISQLEWLGYIFIQLFNAKINEERKSSMIKQLVEECKHEKMLYYVLHMVGNYLENMIDKRVTTQLVTGFECKIQDVRQMYKADSKNILLINISIFDLQYVLECFKDKMLEYRQIVREYLLERIENKQQSASLSIKWTANADILTQIGHLLNCLLFLGGYNNRLQDIVIEALLEKDSNLLDYLQLSYLLYRNIQSTRYKAKVHLISEMQTEAKNKLFQLAGIQKQLKEVSIKELNLQKMLAPGQLVQLLRLLTNLVHINHRSQVPFEKDPKYLHMIMSLTHDSVSQATMKEWAIMFIRNVTEWSQQIREQISKIKIQMKVE